MRFIYQPKDSNGDPLPPLRDRVRAYKSVPRFLRLVWESNRGLTIGLVGLRLVSSVAPLALLWIGKLIVDWVVASLGDASPEWSRLWWLVAFELAIAVTAGLVERAAMLVETLLSDQFGKDISVRLMSHAGRLDYEQFEDPEVLDSLQRARRASISRFPVLTQVLTIAQQGLTAITLLIAISAFSPLLLLGLVLAVLPAFFAEYTYAGISYSFLFRWTRGKRRMDYLQWLAMERAPAKELKVNGLSSFIADRFARLAVAYVAENRRIAAARACLGGGLAALSTVAYYGAVAFVAMTTVLGTITVGTMTFLLGTFQRSRTLITGVLTGTAQGYEHALHLGDLMHFLDLRPVHAPSHDGAPIQRGLSAGLEFQDVGFRYPGSEVWALRNVSLAIDPGECVALVGANGAGKTTVVKLLTRLYQPTEGRILLNGHDIREYDEAAFRRALAVVFQDFFRFDFTARENIAVGEISALEEQGRVEFAAGQAGADDTIRALPRGYEQLLGRRFEGGVELSGGQWQAIALARAHLRNAGIVILDEPTAALDARAEYEVFRQFADLTTGKTTLLISHRFSTVRMASRIVVLEAGRVVEDGTHSELLSVGGSYAELFNLQASGYR